MVKHTLEKMLPIFETAFPPDRFQGLFLFDNATNHCAMAEDALVAKRMNLNRGGQQPLMRDGYNPLTDSPQQMWQWAGSSKEPKGTRIVLEERGLWPQNRHFKLECARKTDHTEDHRCCARRLLASQPDFKSQKGVLAEELEKRGHLVMFYPKFHPELNFIEYYWGAAKRYARENCEYSMAGLRLTIPQALQSVAVPTIGKFYQRTIRSMEAYRDGCKLGTEEYQNRVYRSHRRVA